jgi:catalase
MLCIGAACAIVSIPTIAYAQPSPAETQVNALEGLFGKQSGARRSQAKGVCATGYFTGSAEGRALSQGGVFSGKRIPVVARFSVGGGNPKASDKSRSVRGFAFQMSSSDGEQWQSANISAPIFFVSKPEQFAPFLQARSADPATGKPDPEKLKAFNQANPETTLQAAYLAKAPIPASYAAVNYWGVNAFEVTSPSGNKQFVRWQFVPEAGVVGLTDEQLKTMPDDFLVDELRTRVSSGQASFDLRFQLAEKDDQLVDPTRAWPDSRKTVSMGRLVIDKVEMPGVGACEAMTFNPLILPKGIAPSADPVLVARPVPYAVSLGRRLTEKAAK